MKKTELLVGLDIGTTEVRCAVGFIPLKKDANLQILGIGIARNHGLKKGLIDDHNEVTEAITAAIDQVFVMTGQRVRSATVNINGEHLISEISRAQVAVSNVERRVLEKDVELVNKKAQRQKITKDDNYALVQFLPKEYRLDDQKYIKDPLQMIGKVLAVEALLVKGLINQIESLEKIFYELGIKVSNVTTGSLAAWEAIFDRKTADVGVAVLDIGASTTNLVIIKDSEIAHVSVIPIGGQQVTNDLAIGLKIDQQAAEFIKTKYINLASISRGTKTIRVHGREVLFNPAAATEISRARVEELAEKIKIELDKVDCHQKLPAGILLAGGGSQLTGITDFLRNQLQMATNLAQLRPYDGLVDSIARKREYTTVIGLMSLDGLLKPRIQKSGLEILKDKLKQVVELINRLTSNVKSSR